MARALLVGAFLATSALGACSQVPDALNPAEWYRGTVDFFAGEDDKAKAGDGKDEGLRADRGKAPPGAEQPFPNLASVDRKAGARAKPGTGLSADPDRPQYAPAIARQAEAKTEPPAPAPATPDIATMPPPAAAPTTPVAQAPVQPPTAMPAPQAAPPAVASRPMAPTADQREDEARLTQQLAEIRARAEVPADLPANAQLPAQPGIYDTVVVSSAGIQTPGFAGTAPAPTVTVPAAAGAAGAATAMDTRGALPIPTGAVKVATILFGNGSANLRARDKRILGAVSRLQRERGGTLRIVGHASSRTRNLPPVRHKMANFKVSVDRADMVAGELVRLGVSREAIMVAAVSDSEPLYYEFMPSGEAGNRRTEIFLSN